MSLLLDALKKNGDNQPPREHSMSFSLEELPTTPEAPSATAPTSQATYGSSTSSRAAGETLFAAKKKKPAGGFRWKLGIVPTTFLICSAIGSGYGYYVWLEIQPPKRPVLIQQPVMAPPAPQVATATPPLVPALPAMDEEPALEPIKPAGVASRKPRRSQAEPDTFNPKRTVAPRHPDADTRIAFQRKVDSDSITPALMDAYQAYQRGDYVSARNGYHEVLSKDPHNRDALLGLAAIAQQQNQDETAQYYYRQLLTLDPRDPAAQAALSAYTPKNEGDTESRLKTLLAGQPRSGALHFALGNHYSEQSNWGEAQQSYFNAHTLEPNNAQYTFNLAVSLDHLGQGKLASQFYQQALQQDKTGNSGFSHEQAQQRLDELTTAH